MSWILFWQIVIFSILWWLMLSATLSMVLDHIYLERRRKTDED